MSGAMRTQRDDMVRQISDAAKAKKITNRDRKRSQASLMDQAITPKKGLTQPSGMDMGQKNLYG